MPRHGSSNYKIRPNSRRERHNRFPKRWESGDLDSRPRWSAQAVVHVTSRERAGRARRLLIQRRWVRLLPATNESQHDLQVGRSPFTQARHKLCTSSISPRRAMTARLPNRWNKALPSRPHPNPSSSRYRRPKTTCQSPVQRQPRPLSSW